MRTRKTRPLVLASGLLGAAMVVSACGNSGGVGGTSAAGQATVTAGQTVTLQYETWYPDQATLQKAVDGFEAANPTIKINLRVLKSQDFQKQLPLQLNGGESLDVVGVQVSAMTNTVRSQLRTVDSYAADLGADWKSKLDPGLLAQAQNAASDKTLYDIPMGGVASAYMFYNNKILTQAGVTTPPKTFEELAADISKIQKSDPAVTTPVAFSGEAWWQEEMLFTFAGQKYPTLSDSIIHGDASWNQPQVIDSLNQYKRLFSVGGVQSSVLSLSGGDPDSLFYSGKAAFLIGGSWEASVLSSSFRAQNSIANDDWGAAAVPVADGGQPAVRTLAEGGLAIPKSSKYPAQAAKFISYMTSGAGVDLWNQNLAYVPVAKTGWQPPASVLTTQAARDGLQQMSALAAQQGSERDSQQDFLNNVEGPAILAVLRGTQSPQDAAASLQTQWTSGRYPHGAAK
ncbi:MAG: extracellular solute-binding protein [Catenulispora sp.]|nr:extracellular solute-binding protein [Catenulispora sp.]